MVKGKILVVDDEKSIRKSLSGILSDEGYEVVTASTGEEALAKAEGEQFEAVLLDIWLPGMDGLNVLKEMRRNHPEYPVIMISGHGTISTAVEAVKDGAFDFLEKPLSMERVIITVSRAIYQSRIVRENEELRRRARVKPELVGESVAISEVKSRIESAAPTDAAVLISGENGSGKEVVARLIHQGSRRRENAFIAVNCAAVPEGLIESILFGHEKGAFTGAVKKRVGKIEQAHGGTLFLDEIGDMSTPMQAKLLRFLEEKEIERVGGSRKISVDTRIICATNKNLQDEIERGVFREDLYFRINVIPIFVPPLRERREDIPDLLEHFLSTAAQESGIPLKKVGSKALKKLKEYNWPGNVRELKNLVERLVILSGGDEIDGKDVHSALGFSMRIGKEERRAYPDLYRDALSHFERDFIMAKLKENEMNISKTATRIGLDRTSIHRKLKSLGIEMSRLNEDHSE